MIEDTRIEELLALAEAEGIILPLPPETIIALEDDGHVIDLVTGIVLVGLADTPHTWEWTVEGEALAHLVSLGLVEVGR